MLGGVFHGILQGDLFKTRSLSQTVQRHTDGAFARYYTRGEWTRLTSQFFSVQEIRVYGSKAEMFPLPSGHVKSALMSAVPTPVTRWLTNDLRLGSFLVSILEKPAE